MITKIYRKTVTCYLEIENIYVIIKMKPNAVFEFEQTDLEENL